MALCAGLELGYGYRLAIGDVTFLAFPFLVLGVLVLAGMSRISTSIVWSGLAGLTVLGWVAAESSSSSTAALALVIPLLYGVPGSILTFALDAIVRGHRAGRAHGSGVAGA